MDTIQLLTEIPAQINALLLIGLLAVGYFIKTVPLFDKIENSLIPIVLFILAVAYALLTGSHYEGENALVSSVISGVINAAIAVWLHESGRNIFEILGSKKSSGGGLKDIINSTMDAVDHEVNKTDDK